MPVLSTEELSDHARLLQPSFLRKASNQKDLLRRLHKLINILQTDPSIEPDSPEWPGLAATALTTAQLLQHKDKQVRLYATTACMEIFAIYAPECPWEGSTLCRIFQHTIQQVGNLSHQTGENATAKQKECLQSNNQKDDGCYFGFYTRILDLLADVKIGAVLVELAVEHKNTVPPSIDTDAQLLSDKSSNNSSSRSNDRTNEETHYSARSTRATLSAPRTVRDSSSEYSWTQHLTRDDDVEAPLPLLAHFFHTLLHAVRRQHAAGLRQQFVRALSACLQEFSHGVPVPMPILDELLLCIAAGPTVLVLNTKATAQPTTTTTTTSTNKNAPLHVPAENPAYTTAAKLIQQSQARFVTPVASLLQGLLNSDTYAVSASKILDDPTQAFAGSDVWSTIRYVHRVCPSLLTAVWGTVRQALGNPDAERRHAATLLVGYAVTDTPQMALDAFGLFGAWLQRQFDVQPNIRECLIPKCLALINHWATAHSQAPLSTLPAQALEQTLSCIESLTVSDPALSVRLKAIHSICEIMFKGPSPSSSATIAEDAATTSITTNQKTWIQNSSTARRLLQAVGRRVSARAHAERQDALTGLVRLYEKHYLRHALLPLTNGQSEKEENDEEYKLAAIACQILSQHTHGLPRAQSSANSRTSANATVSPIRRVLWNDSENQSHEDGHNIKNDDEEADSPYAWIPKALFCAASFADMRHRLLQLVDDDVLLKTAKRPQARAVGVALILDALRQDEENLLLDEKPISAAMRYFVQLQTQKAMLQKSLAEYLQIRQTWRSMKKGTEEALAIETQALEMLQKVASLSGEEDFDVVRTLHKAPDKLIFGLLRSVAHPQQSKESKTQALDKIPKRCQTLGEDVAAWTKQLVRRVVMGSFFNADSIQASAELACECFHEGYVSACAILLVPVKIAADIFPSLCGTTEVFGVIRELFMACRKTKLSALKRQLDDWRLVTVLSRILSQAASYCDKGGIAQKYVPQSFQSDLLLLCTGDGTPTQARHAVYALSRLDEGVVKEKGVNLSPVSSDSIATELLHRLASPSQLCPTTITMEKQISKFSALAALADVAPEAFSSSECGQKALIYALENVLMGRNDETVHVLSLNEDKSPLKPAGRVSPQKKRHNTPKAHSILEDESLSPACRRVCAAIAFLTCHVRGECLTLTSHLSEESKRRIEQVFMLLTKVIKDKGLPPNDRDRIDCNSRHERAALRQVAAVNLLRLCDSRLGLERICLSIPMWHTLAESFLDEEQVVRDSITTELVQMLKGAGVYGLEDSKVQPQAPSLRIVSYISLCVDADSSHEGAAANGFAANLGKTGLKKAAETCVTNLRKVCDAMYNTCRANGAEEQFDKGHKMRFMPEYMVPYAFHLVALRRETPAVDSTKSEDNQKKIDNKSPEVFRNEAEADAKERILRRRLKALFDPLIHTLGDNADNISFLLRMSELLGKYHTPVPLAESGTMASCDVAVLRKKLVRISYLAREILLSYVKKDINLEQYPGSVQIPSSLFRRWTKHGSFKMNHETKKVMNAVSNKMMDSTVSKKSSLGFEIRAGSTKTRSSDSSIESLKQVHSRVHFSPELEIPSANSIRTEKRSLDGLSPIRALRSPFASPHGSARDTATLGSSPPSGMRVATVQSSAPCESDDDAASHFGDINRNIGVKTSIKKVVSSQGSEESFLDLNELRNSKRKKTDEKSATAHGSSPPGKSGHYMEDDCSSETNFQSQDTMESSVILGEGSKHKETVRAKRKRSGAGSLIDAETIIATGSERGWMNTELSNVSQPVSQDESKKDDRTRKSVRTSRVIRRPSLVKDGNSQTVQSSQISTGAYAAHRPKIQELLPQNDSGRENNSSRPRDSTRPKRSMEPAGHPETRAKRSLRARKIVE